MNPNRIPHSRNGKRVDKMTMLRRAYDQMEFTETFEEFVELWNREMSSIPSVTDMVMDRQLTRAGFDPEKIKKMEQENYDSGMYNMSEAEIAAEKAEGDSDEN